MLMIPENHAMCQRSRVDNARYRDSDTRALTIPSLVRLWGTVGLEGNVFKDEAVCFLANFPVSVDLALVALSPASSFLPLYFLLHNSPHRECLPFSTKYQAPFSFHLFSPAWLLFQSRHITVCVKGVNSFSKCDQVDVIYFSPC